MWITYLYPLKRIIIMPKKTPNGVDRVTSGIPGLDELIGGGFIPGDVYLVTGGTGTGKTIFCTQFVWEGLQQGENCIYFTLEELPQDVLEDVKAFGWDFDSYIKEKKFVIEYQDPFEMVDITTAVREKIKQFNAKRVVIDSTAIFGMVFKDEHEMRKRLFELMKVLKQTGAVVIITAEIMEDMKALSRFGVEEFIVDGVIVLNYLEYGSGGLNRSLMIRKMRRTRHGQDIYPMDITEKGILIKRN